MHKEMQICLFVVKMFKDAFGVLLKAQCVRFSNIVAKKKHIQ